MSISQVSVFAANRPGALSEITGILAEAGIDIRAFYIADTSDFGILRMIANEPERASSILRERGYVASLNHVLGVRISDVPGAMYSVMKLLSDENIAVEYAYAFVARIHGDAYVILRVDDRERAEKVFAAHELSMLTQEEVRTI